MAREVLALDVDEVLFPFVAEFAPWHNECYGTSVQFGDFYTYEFEDVLKIPLSAVIERVHEFLEARDIHRKAQPLDYAREAVEKLGSQYELVAITARHPQYRLITNEFLKAHFGDYFSNIVLVGHHGNMPNGLQTKAAVCQEIGAVTLVDDSVSHVTTCAEAGIPAVLFGDYRWNQADQADLPALVTRCRDWQAVLEHFDV